MRSHALPQEMAGVEVQAERLTPIEFFEEFQSRIIVKRDLARMHFEGEFHAVFVKFVKNGSPQSHDLVEARFHHGLGSLREGIEVSPDGRTREARDDFHSHLRRHRRCLLHGRDRPCADLVRLVGKFGRRKVVQSGVGSVAHALSDDVRRERLAHKAVFFQRSEDILDILVVFVGAVEVEIAPRGDLEPVIAHLFCRFAKFFERKVRPLTGGQSYKSFAHNRFLLICRSRIPRLADNMVCPRTLHVVRE